MKSDVIFNQIVSIDTLLSFNGIITSLSDFQNKLITLIEQFQLALTAERHLPVEAEGLCHQLCHYLDKKIGIVIKEKSLNWEDYLLLNNFYGYPTSAITDNISLEELLKSRDVAINQYAIKILILSRNLPNKEVRIQQLLARHGHKLLSPEAEAEGNNESHISPTDSMPPEKGEPDDHEILITKPSIGSTVYFSLITLALLLSALWYWCSRYLGNIS